MSDYEDEDYETTWDNLEDEEDFDKESGFNYSEDDYSYNDDEYDDEL